MQAQPTRSARPPRGAVIVATTVATLAAFVLLAAPSASAAGYTAYVGCSRSASVAPTHVCQIGDKPGAFFESEEETEYEVCVNFPSGDETCAEEQLVLANTLYVNAITTNLVGTHLVTWYVEGAEVASWSFTMEEPAPVASPSPGPGSVPAPPPAPQSAVPAPTVIACASGYEGAFSFVSQLPSARSMPAVATPTPACGCTSSFAATGTRPTYCACRPVELRPAGSATDAALPQPVAA
jgi:hypothetical protein